MMILLASEMFKQRVIMGREGAGTVFPGPLNSLDADADTAHGRRRPIKSGSSGGFSGLFCAIFVCYHVPGYTVERQLVSCLATVYISIDR